MTENILCHESFFLEFPHSCDPCKLLGRILALNSAVNGKQPGNHKTTLAFYVRAVQDSIYWHSFFSFFFFKRTLQNATDKSGVEQRASVMHLR